MGQQIITRFEAARMMNVEEGVVQQWLVSGVYWVLGGICLFVALQVMLKLW